MQIQTIEIPSFTRIETQAPSSRIREISDFANRNSLLIRKITDGKNILLLVDEKNTGDIGKDRLLKLFEFYEQIRDKIVDNCYDIAGLFGETNLAPTGSHIESKHGTLPFTGFENHCCNYIYLPDNTVMAVDFTAGKNVDKYSGNFDILGIRAYTVMDLFPKLDELYGGYWNIFSPKSG